MRDLSNVKSEGFNVGDLAAQNLDSLQLFMDAFFGRRRLLILRVNYGKARVIKQLKEYCSAKGFEFTNLDNSAINVDDIKGGYEITYENGFPITHQKTPSYLSNNKQMIFVENIDKNIEIEILRAFCYMGFLNSYRNDMENLPKEKLPAGSAYIFIAEKEFPFEKFASISSHWPEESAVLDLRDFQTRVTEHLGVYKCKIMGITEAGIYKHHQGKEIPLDYILPVDKKDFNIIEKYRQDYIKSKYKNIKFHRYFHHLNSSQAMCINFFYPLIKEKKLDYIVSVIGLNGEVDYKNVSFEKESSIEKENERKTNFDFYIPLKSGKEIFLEIKYTEREFGKATRDDDHKQKYRNTYEPKLVGNHSIKKETKNEEFFLDNYQVMRNLLLIDNDRYVVFIYPEENKGIHEMAVSAREDILEQEWENHFILLTWEELTKEIIGKVDTPLQDYFKEFSLKYLEY